LIDRKLLAEQPEVVGEMLLRRGSSLGDVLAQSGLSDLDFAQLSRQRSEAITRRDALRHRQNTAGPEIARLRRDGGDASALVAEMGGVAEQVKVLEDRLAEIELTYSRVLPYLPNLVDPAVPSGGAAANQELRREGDLPRFDFEPKAHWDLGAQLGSWTSSAPPSSREPASPSIGTRERGSSGRCSSSCWICTPVARPGRRARPDTSTGRSFRRTS